MNERIFLLVIARLARYDECETYIEFLKEKFATNLDSGNLVRTIVFVYIFVGTSIPVGITLLAAVGFACSKDGETSIELAQD